MDSGNLVFWSDLIVIFAALVMATAQALLVVWTNPRNTINWLFIGFAHAVVMWYTFSLLLRISLFLQIGDPTIQLFMATISFALICPFLLLFTNRYVGRNSRFYVIYALAGFVSIILFLKPLFDGRLISDPQLQDGFYLVYHVNPLGYAASALPLVLLLCSFILYWQERQRVVGRRLAFATLLILLAFLAAALLKTPFPINTLGSAAGVLIIGNEVIRKQLLNPLKERTNSLENEVRLRRQAEKALNHSLVELENLQQITETLLEQGDLQETMRTIAKGVVDQLGFDMVLVSRFHEEEQSFAGLAVYPLQKPDQMRKIFRIFGRADVMMGVPSGLPARFVVPYQKGQNSLVDRVLTGETVQGDRLSDFFDPWFCSGRRADAVQKLFSIHYFINMPLRVSGRTVGTIVAGLSSGDISATQEKSLARVADQAAVALEKARLLAETQRQLDVQIAMLRASAAISSALEPDVVVNRLVEQIGQAVDATSAYICTYDSSLNEFLVIAEYIGQKASTAERVSDLGKRYPEDDVRFIENMRQGLHDISHLDDPDLTPIERAHMKSYGAQTVLFIPLLLAGQLIGIVEVWESRYKRRFDANDISLCKGIATQAVVAIENARLHRQLQDHADKLETRVAERTAQLEDAVKELETFSYSVSHDLRAPLRGIDGYAKFLSEDYASVLDDQGRYYIQRVRNAAQKMDLLISNLLRLSRITRHEVMLDLVDLSAIAGDLAGELMTMHPERQIVFDIEEDIHTIADPQLIALALQNLLSNAVKFTAQQPQAHVTFSVDQTGSQPVYCVADNGVGFDMKYQAQLFEPFQRLHSEDDFSGSGVGLSIVQRVIAKHKGHIWAQSVQGHGAQFYFTLG